MMKIYKISLLAVLSVLGVAITYILTVKASETFFYDKLVYKKSPAFGYFNCNPICDLNNLGNRTDGYLSLIKFFESPDQLDNSVLGISKDPETFKIAVIGDSYVFGIGVKEQDQFQNFLKEKLQKERPVEIFSYGFPGDSILDYATKYELIKKTQDINLYVFVLVENDLILRKNSIYPSSNYSEILNNCDNPDSPLVFENKNPEEDYLAKLFTSLNSKSNQCVLSEAIKLLPKDAVYFSVDLDKDIELPRYISPFTEAGFKIVSAKKNGKEIPEFSKVEYWNNPKKFFQVSHMEKHPSPFAHKMFAEILYKEITTNYNYGFTN